MKIKKVVSSLAAVTMALSSFAALSVTAGAEEAGFSKTVDLQNAQTTFNRVVVKGDNVPEDLSISVVNGDTEETISADTRYQLFNKDHVYGVFNATANANSTYGQYKSYTGDALKLTSSEDVSDLKVEVYNAADVARTGKEIADDNTLFTITPWSSEISDTFATDNIYNNGRFNNPVNNNPAHIYNMSSDFVEYKKKNQPNTDGLTENNGVDLVMKLNGEKNISQISYGNINSIGENKFAGDSYTVYYRTGDDGEWIKAQDEYRADSKENHFICNLLTPVNASEIKLAIEFNPNSKNTYPESSSSVTWTALYLSYLGIYDFGDNLAAKDTSVGSNEADLGKAYTFNKLTSEAVGTWQYKDANDKWVNIPEDGSDVTTRYIRVAGEDMIDKATPTFELSWEGNLVKYANEQKNGASLTVALPRNNADYSTWYDGKNNTAVSNQSTDKNAITLSFNGKANIKNVKETFGSGCWYPASIAIYASTNASDNVKIASVQNTLRVGDDGVHDTKRNEHNSYFENNFDINESVSNIVIKSLGSIRNECWAFIDNASTTQDVNVAEIEIPGSVDLVSYNGTSVTVPKADGELTEIKEASATYGNEVTVSAEESSDGKNAVGYVVTLNPNGNSIKELGVQATGVGTDSVKKRLGSSATFGGITGDSEFVFGFAASGVDSLSNIVVTADGEAVSTTAAE